MDTGPFKNTVEVRNLGIWRISHLQAIFTSGSSRLARRLAQNSWNLRSGHVFGTLPHHVPAFVSKIAFDTILTRPGMRTLEMLGMAKNTSSQRWTAGFLFLRREAFCHGAGEGKWVFSFRFAFVGVEECTVRVWRSWNLGYPGGCRKNTARQQ